MSTASLAPQDLPEIVPRLSPEVREAIRLSAEAILATPKGKALDTGGLLLGVSEKGPELLIDRLETVPCERRYGSEHRLSPDDTNALRTKAQELRKIAEHRIVGFLRISMRYPLGFALEENATILEHVPECRWFFFARGVAGSRVRVRVFRFTGTGWSQAADYEILQPAERVPAVKRQPTPWLRTAAFVCGVVGNIPPFVSGTLAACVILGVFWFCRHPPPLPGASDLGLRVAVDGNMLGVIWDDRSPAVKRAGRGTLQIEDGSRHREIRLDSRQLAGGLVLYRPESADVTFRLTVPGEKGRLAESVRWTGRPDALAGGEFMIRSAVTAAPAGAASSAEPLVQAERPPAGETPVDAGAQGRVQLVVKTPAARVTIRRADAPQSTEQAVVAGALRLAAGLWVVHAEAPGFQGWTGRLLVKKTGSVTLLIRLRPQHAMPRARS